MLQEEDGGDTAQRAEPCREEEEGVAVTRAWLPLWASPCQTRRLRDKRVVQVTSFTTLLFSISLLALEHHSFSISPHIAMPAGFTAYSEANIKKDVVKLFQLISELCIPGTARSYNIVL